MVLLLSLAVLGIGVIWSYFNPLAFLVLFGVTASPYEGFGVSKMLSTANPYFGICMNIMLFVTMFFSVRQSKYKISGEKIIPVILSFLFIIRSLIVVFLNKHGVSVGTSFNSFLSDLVYLSPVYLIILIMCEEKYDIKKYFLIFLTIQICSSFLAIYLPEFGIHFLDPLRSVNYMPYDKARLFDHQVALPNNFYRLFINKYVFNQTGYFHNSNDTGFYGATGLFVFLYLFFTNKKYKVYNLALAFISMALWFNSGMRGPILGIIAGTMLYMIWSDNHRKRVIRTMMMMIFVLALELAFELSAADLQLNQGLLESISGRLVLGNRGIEFILKHPFIGNGGVFTGLGNIDPHELTLRISVLFGIVSGAIIFILVYVIPISKILNMQRDLFSFVLLMIVLSVAVTNNYTCIVLFYFMLFLSAYRSEKNRLR